MDIYISINNRERVIQIPILPEEITIGSPQNNQSYETIELGELNLIGKMGLASLEFSSFFPYSPLSFSKNNSMYAWDYVTLFEDLRKRRLPFRIIISETPVNLAVTIENFEYGMKPGKHVYYTLSLKEFRFVEVK